MQVSEIIIFKSAAGSISFKSAVSQSCSIHACVRGWPTAARRPRLGGYDGDAGGWLLPAMYVRLVGDIRHAEAVFHKVFGQENEPGAPVTSSQGARDTNVRPPNRAWEGRSRPAKLAAGGSGGENQQQGQGWGAWPCGHFSPPELAAWSANNTFSRWRF